MSPRKGVTLLPLPLAPKIVAGETLASDANGKQIVREIVFQGPTSVAVYLGNQYEVSEIAYHVTEATKRKEATAEWRALPRTGAQRFALPKPPLPESR